MNVANDAAPRRRHHEWGLHVEDRRTQIVQALHRCIREKGYAGTSLTDIAVGAGMSPSHIRYYFEGKDAILEYYFDLHCRRIIEDIRAIDDSDPIAWFKGFMGYFIANPHIHAVGLSVIVEIFGLSVHQPRLREIKTTYDAEMLSILRVFFERVGTVGVTPMEAAEILQALEVGLKWNAVFQNDYEPDKAARAILTVLPQLIGRPIGI
jgi:AcrR family transcriptional regulator